MTTVYPENPLPFNEWAVYIHKKVTNPNYEPIIGNQKSVPDYRFGHRESNRRSEGGTYIDFTEIKNDQRGNV